MQLVLTKDNRSIAGLRSRASAQCNKKSGGTQIMGMLRQRQNQTILQAKQTQQCVALIQCDMRTQILGILILHHKTVSAMTSAIVHKRHVETVATAASPTFRSKKLLQCHIVVPWQSHIQWMLALHFGTPIVSIIQKDLVKARRLVCFNNKGVILWRHEYIEFTLRHVDNDTYIDIHESWLNDKEHRLARLQSSRLRFALLCKKK